jgi:hypothetical protein
MGSRNTVKRETWDEANKTSAHPGGVFARNEPVLGGNVARFAGAMSRFLRHPCRHPGDILADKLNAAQNGESDLRREHEGPEAWIATFPDLDAPFSATTRGGQPFEPVNWFDLVETTAISFSRRWHHVDHRMHAAWEKPSSVGCAVPR